jgi:hypothetical protein
VQIQADCPDRSPAKKTTASKLCQDINNMLAKYGGMTGGAQISPARRNIRITTTPND